MGERQRKLGDSWNECAGRLLKQLGWVHVGDSDMDLPGIDSKEYGIDSIMKYQVAGKKMMQTVLLESKRYGMKSIQAGTLQNWLETLKNKLNKLRNSKDLLKEFEELEECSPTNLGIIMLWVHDADDAFLNDTLQKRIENTIINTGGRVGAYSRIMVLDNRRIVRLCSMIDALKGFDDYDFVYPAGIIDNEAIVENKVLSVEYMMSDIILAECKKLDKFSSVVFYFGKMTESNVNTLLEFLKVYQRVDSKKKLQIYYYDSTNVTQDVINSFKKKDCYKDIIAFNKLAHFAYNDEPSLIANDEQ